MESGSATASASARPTTVVPVIEAVAWDHPDAIALREARRVEIAETYGREDSEPQGSAASAEDVSLFVVAYDDGVATGCGALRMLDDGAAEVKRMYVAPDKRGTGTSTAILRALESWAVEHSIDRLVLETGDLLIAAQRFYEREGYTRIPPFGPYVGSALSVCYEKRLR